MFKVFIEFCYSVASLLCFGLLFVCLFDHEACEILASQSGIELELPALEGKSESLHRQKVPPRLYILISLEV